MQFTDEPLRPFIAAAVPPLPVNPRSQQVQRQRTYFRRIRLILYTQILASVITGLSAACDTRRLELLEPLETVLALLTVLSLPLMLIAFPAIMYSMVRPPAPLHIRMAILVAASMSTVLHWFAAVPLVQ